MSDLRIVDGGESREGVGDPPIFMLALNRRQAEYICDLLGATACKDIDDLGLDAVFNSLDRLVGVAVNGVGIDEDGVLVWNRGAERKVYGKDDDGE